MATAPHGPAAGDPPPHTHPQDAAPTAPSEIEELRSDIAALWLAFGQHERILRDLVARLGAALGAAGAVAGGGREQAGAAQEPSGPPPISRQLSDLDDVLAAIERATEVLERTHADELGAEPDERQLEADEQGPEPDEQQPGDYEQPGPDAQRSGD